MPMRMRQWFQSGLPWIWLNAGAVSISLVMVLGLLGLIAARGLGHFWPADVVAFEYRQPDGAVAAVLGEIHDQELVASQRLSDPELGRPGAPEAVRRYLVKTGNRDVLGLDFRWLQEHRIERRATPPGVVVLERREWGNFYGYLDAVEEDGRVVATGAAAWEALHPRLERARALNARMRGLQTDEIGAVSYRLERLRLAKRRLELEQRDDPEVRAAIAAEEAGLGERFAALQGELNELSAALRRDSLVLRTAGAQIVEVSLGNVVHAVRPNAMGLPEKVLFYLEKLWEFVSDEPREANTEGGIFPAIFGTVMMVFLMSIFVMPFGVVAAIYLREYARQGVLVRTIRIAVNNLAGVPSIVYGVFGLGFFVYFLGGNIDRLFYPEAFPAPTFGTPGILWSSLTLAILTVPVVIVATEEGLTRVPIAIREGSLALGATKFETLWRTIVPMTTPAIMTGLILAIARAAGEVAPLMLVGVVKLAPSLPLDGNFPFLHMDRKFMHLGFHIYDVGFQSPNVEAARPLVYATALLLVAVIVVLNLAAITIRNRLREKYRSLEQ